MYVHYWPDIGFIYDNFPSYLFSSREVSACRWMVPGTVNPLDD